MKKDIKVEKVQDIAIAIVPSDEVLWDVYLINLKPQRLKNVLINSRGYGQRKEEKVKTSTLRYYYEMVEGETAIKVESVQTALFDLTHEYWLSFQVEGESFLFDKKYTFVAGSLQEEFFSPIPFLANRGVMIR